MAEGKLAEILEPGEDDRLMIPEKAMRCLIQSTLAIALATGGIDSEAAEEPIFSGPQVGEKITPFKVKEAYGPQAGKKRDYVELAGGKPTLLVFAHRATRPAASVTRALLNYAEMRQRDGLFAAMIWLPPDPSQAEQYLQRAVSWWGVGVPVGVSSDGREGPGNYGLNRHVALTILIARNNKVTANFALIQPSDTDVPKILGEVVKLIDGKVPTRQELEFLRMPTHLAGKPARNGKAPQDAELRERICSLLAVQEDPGRLAKAAAAIEAYAEKGMSRQEKLVQAARSLARLRFASAGAKKWFRHFVAKYEASAPPVGASINAPPAK